MTSPHVRSFTTAMGAVAISLIMLVVATGAAAQAGERTWAVECGLPLEDNSILALLPTGGYTGTWPGDSRRGHFEAKTVNRPHPDGGIVTEMWLLSRAIGWWKLKAMWVHPDDLTKLAEGLFDNGSQLSEVRQIIDSPFLSQPAVVPAGDSEAEETVTAQILALLPDASRLRCDTLSE